MIVSRIPYRETEDYIADSVALLALEKYEKQLKDIFSICDLGCGNGIVLHKILNQLNSSEIESEIKVHLIDIDGRSPQQQWIWHTGEDVITAVKNEDSPFLLSYRPSLLDPSFL